MYLRPLGDGAVLYNTLGHCRGHYDMVPAIDYYPTIERGSWEHPAYYELLRRSLRWARGADQLSRSHGTSERGRRRVDTVEFAAMASTEPTASRAGSVDHRRSTATGHRHASGCSTAAADACVEFGYEGATLSDIARRADVSTPAIYSHFSGKAELLVEACQRELYTISSDRLRRGRRIARARARAGSSPTSRRSRIIVAEIHCAAIRQPEVADLLGVVAEGRPPMRSRPAPGSRRARPSSTSCC